MEPADDDQLVTGLPGGGSLGFADFGDPAGVPCFAFHGLSSSRLMPGWMFPPELLATAGVRMIGVDRPGYGLSTVPWAIGFTDWPRAVGALADHLGVSRFAVLAHSLGSAYALACGPALADRLAVIVIASGMGPLKPGERFHSGSRTDDLYWRLARRARWLLDPLCRLNGAMALRAARGDPQRFTRGMAFGNAVAWAVMRVEPEPSCVSATRMSPHSDGRLYRAATPNSSDDNLTSRKCGAVRNTSSHLLTHSSRLPPTTNVSSRGWNSPIEVSSLPTGPCNPRMLRPRSCGTSPPSSLAAKPPP